MCIAGLLLDWQGIDGQDVTEIYQDTQAK
ncbi:unnamed protein product [Nezara viridula]|uniref:Uncharacterized protein n=1 Tax=Nezara viridula TaxID=85310 RepID=A0A9P0H432_NEZVI|nr:unnamed protein product [Nezara viridula]